jgi:hypothetical protein
MGAAHPDSTSRMVKAGMVAAGVDAVAVRSFVHRHLPRSSPRRSINQRAADGVRTVVQSASHMLDKVPPGAPSTLSRAVTLDRAEVWFTVREPSGKARRNTGIRGRGAEQYIRLPPWC